MNSTRHSYKKNTDLNRLGRRLKRYLPGLEKITRVIEEEISNRSSGPLEIDDLFRKSLPYLCDVFNSPISFTADEKRNVIMTYPESIMLLGKILPKTFEDTKRFPGNDPLVFNDTSRHFQELQDLQIDSVMILKSEVQEKIRWIGVCNRRDEPGPYLSEDKKFLKAIIQLFNFGLSYGERYGEIKTEEIFSSDRYKEALKKGECGYLSRASVQLGRNYKQLKTYFRGSDSEDKEDLELTGDEILAHFLEAELCRFILKVPFAYTTEESKSEPEPWGLFEPCIEKKKFDIILYGNRGEFKSLPTHGYKRTVLAGARIMLVSLLFSKIFKKTDDPKKLRSKEKSVEELIKLNHPTIDINIGENGSFEWVVDWLRTQWLSIYYFSWKGTNEPVPNEITKRVEVDKKSWEITVKIIQQYLKQEYLRKTNRQDEAKSNLKKSETVESDDFVDVDSDWLLAFLAQNVLLSRSINDYYDIEPTEKEKETGPGKKKENKKNPLTRVRFLLYLSHYVLYILYCVRFARRGARYGKEFQRPPFADIPVAPTANLSDTIIFIMSEYAYREIGIPRELLIFEKLRRQLNFELPLYTTSDFYRDHLFHVVDVCLLGELLLQSGVPGSWVGKNRTYLQHLKAPKDAGLLKNWYVAALCHDLGYVVERVEKLMDPVQQLRGPGLDKFSDLLKKGLAQGKEELRETIEALIDSSDLSISEKLEKCILHRVARLDHGVIGWLYLCHILKGIDVKLSEMAPALRAILRHNLTDHDEDIHKEPLSFLLLLCDHLQEWGRPRVRTDQLTSGVMESLRFPNRNPNFDMKIRVNRLYIKGLSFESSKIRNVQESLCQGCIGGILCDKKGVCLRTLPKILDKKNGLEFYLHHQEALEADFEPVLSWLFFCRDFQCMDYSKRKFLFPIAIHCIHHPSRIRQLLNWKVREIDILEEFANSQEKAAYLCRWIETAIEGKGDKGIMYKENITNGEETFTIRLDRLERPLERGLKDEHWKNFKKWKRQWLRQKYFVSNVGPWYQETD